VATPKQRAAARKNIKKAATTGSKKCTIAHLPPQVRTELDQQGAAAAARGAREEGAGFACRDDKAQKLPETCRLDSSGNSYRDVP
jgi:hypothetical protein